jgi:hypothetical protein
MIPTQAAVPPTSRSIRLIHASMVIGVILFALVSHFSLRATFAISPLPPFAPPTLLGVSLVAIALALILRKRIPRRSTDASADLFWKSASTPALVVWSLLDGASLIAVLVYAFTGAEASIGVAVIAIVIFVLVNPARLERR